MRAVGIEDRRERHAVVRGLPDSARGEADVVRGRILLVHRDVVHPSPLSNGADGAPSKAAEQRIGGDIDGGRVALSLNGRRLLLLLRGKREWKSQSKEGDALHGNPG